MADEQLCAPTGHRWWQTVWTVENNAGTPVMWQRVCRNCGHYAEHNTLIPPDPVPF